MTPEITQRSEALFDEAERVADSPKVLARVKHARLSLEYVTVMRRVKSATASEDAEERAATLAALKDFAARCAADGIARPPRRPMPLPWWRQAGAVLERKGG